jgi:hypothetical protein
MAQFAAIHCLLVALVKVHPQKDLLLDILRYAGMSLAESLRAEPLPVSAVVADAFQAQVARLLEELQ